jgi:UDPglucose 6-dehydrogenase
MLAAIYEPLTSGAYYARPDAIAGARSTLQPPKLLDTSTKSAEIIKHASNAFLALKISFINAVSNLCEATDANIEQVAQGIGLDSRIGPKFFRPGIGYGGSCFPKDVAAFRSVAEQLGVDFGLLTEVEKINAQQKKRFLSKVRSALWTLRGKRLGVLGLAFKGETDDIRESPAIDMVEMLTDWAEFAKLDLKRIATVMRYPIVVDGRNLFDPQRMHEHGFTYISIGRPAVYPARDIDLAVSASA